MLVIPMPGRTVVSLAGMEKALTLRVAIRNAKSRCSKPLSPELERWYGKKMQLLKPFPSTLSLHDTARLQKALNPFTARKRWA